MESAANFVIVGGAGFIGFHLSDYFSRNGHTVHIIDNFSNSNADSEFEKLTNRNNVFFSSMDASQSAFKSCINENSIVLNLAAINGTQNFYEQPFTVLQKSALVGINIAEFCALTPVRQYYYFGSSESYAGGVNLGIIGIPTPEDVPLVIENPSNERWSYATAKTIGEVAFFAARKQYGLKGGIFRLHNIYGPRMGYKHVIPDLIKKFTNGNYEVLNCNHTRAFLYSFDLVEIIYNIVRSDFWCEDFPVMNIGSGVEIEIGELAKMICKFLNIEEDIICRNSHPGSVARRVPDISKMLSYYPFQLTSLESGIRETCNYYTRTS